jgi:hypothetical protein
MTEKVSGDRKSGFFMKHKVVPGIAGQPDEVVQDYAFLLVPYRSEYRQGLNRRLYAPSGYVQILPSCPFSK